MKKNILSLLGISLLTFIVTVNCFAMNRSNHSPQKNSKEEINEKEFCSRLVTTTECDEENLTLMSTSLSKLILDNKTMYTDIDYYLKNNIKLNRRINALNDEIIKLNSEVIDEYKNAKQFERKSELKMDEVRVFKAKVKQQNDEIEKLGKNLKDLEDFIAEKNFNIQELKDVNTEQQTKIRKLEMQLLKLCEENTLKESAKLINAELMVEDLGSQHQAEEKSIDPKVAIKSKFEEKPSIQSSNMKLLSEDRIIQHQQYVEEYKNFNSSSVDFFDIEDLEKSLLGDADRKPKKKPGLFKCCK